jgi:protein gp37
MMFRFLCIEPLLKPIQLDLRGIPRVIAGGETDYGRSAPTMVILTHLAQDNRRTDAPAQDRRMPHRDRDAHRLCRSVPRRRIAQSRSHP